MKLIIRQFLIPIAAILVMTAGCKEEAKPKAVTPSVKVFTVGKKATGQARRISGTVEAADSSILSFGVSGQVLEIIVSDGEEVRQGQLLARLDEEPLRIRLEDARARLSSARAKLIEAQATFDRTKKLFASKGASQKELDSAEANLAAAQASVDSNKGQLSQAELDFNRTKLTAPFGGKVQKKHVENFQEVTANEKIITLQTSSALEIKVRVPETMIQHVSYGQLVGASFPSQPDVQLRGTVSVIAAEAEDGNAYPVTVRLARTEEDIRPGMTASVTFNFDSYLEGKTAYLIPISAFAVDTALMKPGEYSRTPEKKEVPVFVFDEATKTIKERKVLVGELRDNELEVFDGLSAGENVVSAGVPFVRDGMKAKIWIPMSKVSSRPAGLKEPIKEAHQARSKIAPATEKESVDMNDKKAPEAKEGV